MVTALSGCNWMTPVVKNVVQPTFWLVGGLLRSKPATRPLAGAASRLRAGWHYHTARHLLTYTGWHSSHPYRWGEICHGHPRSMQHGRSQSTARCKVRRSFSSQYDDGAACPTFRFIACAASTVRLGSPCCFSFMNRWTSPC